MKITTTWSDLNCVPWQSVFRCAEEYKKNNPGHNDDYYREYMLDTWGMDLSNERFRIANEQKYMMFLLRWT